MKIAGIQKVSLVDFDGHISTTLFTAGCNFACPFCHNAGIVREYEPILPIQDIMAYLEKRKKVLDAVVITGGEPTIHDDLPDFIKSIKDMGYLVKLDTNGTNLPMLKSLVENNLIDYIAMDIKNSLESYEQTICRPKNFDPKETIDYIMNCGVPYEFRSTLVDGLHTEEDIISIAQLLQGAEKYYLQKFVDSGNCLQTGLKEITKKQAEHFAQILSEKINYVGLRGY